MKPSAKHSRALFFRAMTLALLVFAISLVVFMSARQPAPPTNHQVPSKVQPIAAATNPASQPPMASAAALPAAVPGVLPNYPDFQPRPLTVAVESTNFQWSSADAKATNIIRQIAHNDLEYQRMVEENTRIQRRQLVYSKNTAAAALQHSRLSGESVTQLILPGFDGKEFQFAIERADLEPSKQSGTFAGRLAGRSGSMVTLAFKLGREAFTIVSPEDGIYLQGHPREPGQIIVTSFDPDTYMPLPCGEPIKTAK